jgi:carbamoyl-phosphate synthase large subunit
MNILFTCAGRRNYLLGYFKELYGTRIFACDASVYAPALYVADEFFIVPEVYDKKYVSVLLGEARNRKINAIIPLNDLELPILSLNKKLFEEHGIKIVVSDKDVIDLCFDKYKTLSFSDSLSINRIPTFISLEEALEYRSKNPECNFIIKPRWGTASIGISYPKNDSELIYQYNLTKEKLVTTFLNEISSTDYENSVLIQQVIKGQEYGIDVINNLDRKYEATLIRRKISMRAGETDKAETVNDENLRRIGKEIGEKIRHIGVLDCDMFVDNGKIYLLEMNPRFGGGYPFSHAAGANVPLAITEWLKGNPTPSGCFDYKNNFISAKADRIVEMNSKKNVYIIGASGLGREIETWISKSSRFKEKYSLKGFIDDNPDALKGFPSEYRVLGKIDQFEFNDDDYVILGVADPKSKQNITSRLENKVRFLSFISDSSIIGKFVEIGEGTVIAPNCIISNNIRIGSFVTINVGSVVGHDTDIYDFSSIMANVNISGMIRICSSVFIGSNSTIVPGKIIGKNSKICAGSVVITDTPEFSFSFGNPAKIVKKKPNCRDQ